MDSWLRGRGATERVVGEAGSRGGSREKAIKRLIEEDEVGERERGGGWWAWWPIEEEDGESSRGHTGDVSNVRDRKRSHDEICKGTYVYFEGLQSESW